jgi:2-methylcitrate dehydratase
MDVLDPEKWDPDTRETADHSLPYCIARAVVDGEVTLEHFHEDAINDSRVSDVIDLITIEEDPEYTSVYGDKFPHYTKIHTEHGVFEQEVAYPKGHPRNPMEPRDIEEKFTKATSKYVSQSDREAILEFLWNLERQSNVQEIFELPDSDV